MTQSTKIQKQSCYGRPVLSNGVLKYFPRLKNSILTRLQYRILHHFGNRRERSIYARAFAKLARRVIGPYLYSVKLEVNNVCDLKCEMCYVPKGKSNLPAEQIERFFRDIRKKGVRVEILGGEPLLRKDIVEVLQKAKTIAQTPFLSMYTNGTRVTSELAEEMKYAGLDAAIVTLVSAKAEVHDAFTGVQGSWQATVSGIRLLRKAGIETYTFSAIHSRNISEAEDIFAFAREELKVHPLFYQYIPQQLDDPLIVDRNEWFKVKNSILKRIPEHAEFVRDFYMLTGNACSGGNFVLTVKSDGSVQPCPFISDIPLGNIAEKSIWKIYRDRYAGTDLKELKKLPDECRSCTYASVCGGGCRAGNRLLSGAYDTKDRRCPGPYDGLLVKDEVVMKAPCYF